MIVDLILPTERLNELAENGQQPLVLLANRVVHDTDATSRVEALTVTGFAQDFFGCFVEADRKMYVLAGRGARKYSAMPALAAFKRLHVGADNPDLDGRCPVPSRGVSHIPPR